MLDVHVVSVLGDYKLRIKSQSATYYFCCWVTAILHSVRSKGSPLENGSHIGVAKYPLAQKASRYSASNNDMCISILP